MTEPDFTKGPEAEAGDHALALAKVAASLVPIAGGLAVELLGLIQSPLETKMREWVEDLAVRLRVLEERVEGFSFEQLAGNDDFQSTFLYASQLAVRTTQESKRDALRNIVLNTALNRTPDEDLRLMFMNYIDSFTSWHLRVLSVLDELDGWTNKYYSLHPTWNWDEPMTVIDFALPEIKDREDLLRQLLRDLHARGLITKDDYHVTVVTTQSGRKPLFVSQTTTMGKQFLQYIAEPSPDAEQ